MQRIVLGAVAALLLVSAGLFWWQGRAASERGNLPAGAQLADLPPAGDAELPTANGRGLRGDAPPQASEITREERRFHHVDRNSDGRVTPNEMLAPRVAAFRKLDGDGNNLLSFDEWAVKTSNRFRAADANGDRILDRGEFATTRPKPKAHPDCRCAAPRAAPPRPGRRGAQAAAPPAADEDDPSADDGGAPTG